MTPTSKALVGITALIGATYLVVVDYAGTEPVASLLFRDAVMYVGASTALGILWFQLGVLVSLAAFRRAMPAWISGGLVVLCCLGIWISTWTPVAYIDTLRQQPSYSCPCLRTTAGENGDTASDTPPTP